MTRLLARGGVAALLVVASITSSSRAQPNRCQEITYNGQGKVYKVDTAELQISGVVPGDAGVGCIAVDKSTPSNCVCGPDQRHKHTFEFVGASCNALRLEGRGDADREQNGIRLCNTAIKFTPPAKLYGHCCRNENPDTKNWVCPAYGATKGSGGVSYDEYCDDIDTKTYSGGVSYDEHCDDIDTKTYTGGGRDDEREEGACVSTRKTVFACCPHAPTTPAPATGPALFGPRHVPMGSTETQQYNCGIKCPHANSRRRLAQEVRSRSLYVMIEQ